MNLIGTDNPLAISLLLNDDIYLIKEKAAPLAFDYWGGNAKFILVVHTDAQEKYSTEADKTFLLKMLAALKLTEEHIAFLNIAHYPNVVMEQLIDFFACNKVLVFGVNPQQLNCDASAYNIVELQRVKLLCADSLQVLTNDVTKKTALWKQLQQLFGIGK